MVPSVSVWANEHRTCSSQWECLSVIGEIAQVPCVHWPLFRACWVRSQKWFGTKVALSRMWSGSLSWMVWSTLLWLRAAFRNAFSTWECSAAPLHVHISVTVQHLYYHGNTRMFRPVLLWVCERACVCVVAKPTSGFLFSSMRTVAPFVSFH